MIIEIPLGAYIIALVGGTGVAALALSAKRTHDNWIESAFDSIRDHLDDVEISRLSELELHELTYKPRGDVFDSRGLHIELAERISGHTNFSDFYRFRLVRKGFRPIQWVMNPKTNEFVMQGFNVADEKSRLQALKHKDQLKEIGKEVYVYWKMSNT